MDRTTELTADQEGRLRESFKRCSSETLEAILNFRKHRDTCSVPVAVHGIFDRYVRLEPGQSVADRPDSARLGEDLGIDSLTMLEIVMSIEEALNFHIDNQEVRNILTLGDVRKYVDDRIHHRTVSLASLKAYNRDQLCLIMAQQPPFMFLDRAEIQGDTVRAWYTFRGDEFFFAGHFRDEPIVPASIVFECAGQAGCLWVLERAQAQVDEPISTKNILFVGVDSGRFSHRAKPGDEIMIELRSTRLRSPLAVFEGTVSSKQQLLGKIEGLILAFGDFSSYSLDAAPATANGVAAA